MERVGIIDIGTHSVLYLLAQCNEDGIIECPDQALRSVRLGHNMMRTGHIAQDRIAEVARVVKTFAASANQDGASRCIAVGTQVFRTAKNSQEALDIIEQTSGISVDVLTPEDEALWSSQGALYGRDQSDRAVVADIGGGSTEIIAVKPDTPPAPISHSIGAVVLTECFLQHNPPTGEEIEAGFQTIRSFHDEHTIHLLSSADKLVCVGGTITTLAALHLKLSQYDSSRVDGAILTLEQIQAQFDQLRTLNLDQRRTYMKLDPERAGIILAGTMILLEVIRSGHFKSVLVSDRGLRFGIALRTFQMT